MNRKKKLLRVSEYNIIFFPNRTAIPTESKSHADSIVYNHQLHLRTNTGLRSYVFLTCNLIFLYFLCTCFLLQYRNTFSGHLPYHFQPITAGTGR